MKKIIFYILIVLILISSTIFIGHYEFYKYAWKGDTSSENPVLLITTQIDNFVDDNKEQLLLSYLKIAEERFEDRNILINYSNSQLNSEDLAPFQIFSEKAQYDLYNINTNDLKLLPFYRSNLLPLLSGNFSPLNTLNRINNKRNNLSNIKIFKRKNKSIANINLTIHPNHPIMIKDSGHHFLYLDPLKTILKNYRFLSKKKIDYTYLILSTHQGARSLSPTIIKDFIKKIPPNFIDFIIYEGKELKQETISNIILFTLPKEKTDLFIIELVEDKRNLKVKSIKITEFQKISSPNGVIKIPAKFLGKEIIIY